ncbi:hypothetical protein, partial [Rhizobium brockwellii]|uniref:hypothetical protein n=1 Tax=Rhizobium brockwellii TaxID=3019932 RepID=UPI003F9DC1BA
GCFWRKAAVNKSLSKPIGTTVHTFHAMVAYHTLRMFDVAKCAKQRKRPPLRVATGGPAVMSANIIVL